MRNLLKKHSEKLRFVTIGGINTAIDVTILFLLVNLGISIFFSNMISTSVALMFSFFANKKFTFRNSDSNSRQFPTFLLITLSGLWIIQPLIIVVVQVLLYYAPYDEKIILLVGKGAATVVTLIWNYFLYKKYVFQKEMK